MDFIPVLPHTHITHCNQKFSITHTHFPKTDHNAFTMLIAALFSRHCDCNALVYICFLYIDQYIVVLCRSTTDTPRLLIKCSYRCSCVFGPHTLNTRHPNKGGSRMKFHLLQHTSTKSWNKEYCVRITEVLIQLQFSIVFGRTIR